MTPTRTSDAELPGKGLQCQFVPSLIHDNEAALVAIIAMAVIVPRKKEIEAIA